MPRPSRLAFLLLMLCTGAAFAASTVSGVVTNKTTGKPSAGDDVVLLRLQQGMQEAARTKSDAKGRFTLQLPEDGLHLVRVTHDQANYFQPLQDTTQPIAIDVYNAAAKVTGVSHEADVMRMETDGGGANLKVVENFFVKNDSNPPMTQYGSSPQDIPFDFYLPAGATVQGSAALAPGGMPVQTAPVPLTDAPNHYAFLFPIRPGETRFQVQFTLPYTGSLKFAPKPTSPTDTIAIILPKSMKFAAGPSAPYAAMADEVDGQTFVARNAQPSQPLEFTISGAGQLPRDTQAAQQAGAADTAGSADASGGSGDITPSEASARQRADTRPGVGLNNPLDSDGNLEPWAKYKWWIIGLLGIALAGGAGMMLRSGPAGAVALAPAQPAQVPLVPGPGALLQALKDELFELETDRLSGKLTETEYAEQKAALEVVLRRALARAGEANTAKEEAVAVDV